jgi:mannose/fructose/N-acetylgalactosamine-specific phosphotransferase system component IID
VSGETLGIILFALVMAIVMFGIGYSIVRWGLA